MLRQYGGGDDREGSAGEEGHKCASMRDSPGTPMISRVVDNQFLNPQYSVDPYVSTRGDAWFKKIVLYYLDGTDGKHYDLSAYPPKHFEAYCNRQAVVIS